MRKVRAAKDLRRREEEAAERERESSFRENAEVSAFISETIADDIDLYPRL